MSFGRRLGNIVGYIPLTNARTRGAYSLGTYSRLHFTEDPCVAHSLSKYFPPPFVEYMAYSPPEDTYVP